MVEITEIINIYRRYLRSNNLNFHLLIVADASIDFAKRAIPDKFFLSCGW